MAYGIACALYFIIYCIYESFTLKRSLGTFFGRQISKVFVIDSLSDMQCRKTVSIKMAPYLRTSIFPEN